MPAQSSRAHFFLLKKHALVFVEGVFNGVLQKVAVLRFAINSDRGTLGNLEADPEGQQGYMVDLGVTGSLPY